MALSSAREHPDALPRSAAQSRRGLLLQQLCFAQLLLLAVEFLIGVVNLFVTLPVSHPGSQASDYFGGIGASVAWALVHGAAGLQLHVVGGIALFVGACVLVYLAIAERHGGWIAVAVVGWIGIVAASFNGASFLNYGHDVSSFLMALGLFLALVAYASGLYARGDG
jgi:hypothetical protein